MLGLPLTNAVDVWSLGRLAARLYLGRQLYHRSTEDEVASVTWLVIDSVKKKSLWKRVKSARTLSLNVWLQPTAEVHCGHTRSASRWHAGQRGQNSHFLQERLLRFLDTKGITASLSHIFLMELQRARGCFTELYFWFLFRLKTTNRQQNGQTNPQSGIYSL